MYKLSIAEIAMTPDLFNKINHDHYKQFIFRLCNGTQFSYQITSYYI